MPITNSCCQQNIFLWHEQELLISGGIQSSYLDSKIPAAFQSTATISMATTLHQALPLKSGDHVDSQPVSNSMLAKSKEPLGRSGKNIQNSVSQQCTGTET